MLTYTIKMVFSWLLVIGAMTSPQLEVLEKNTEGIQKCCMEDPASKKCIVVSEEYCKQKCAVNAKVCKLSDQDLKACSKQAQKCAPACN